MTMTTVYTETVHDTADIVHDGAEPVGDGHAPAPGKVKRPSESASNPAAALFVLPLGDAIRVDAALLPEVEQARTLRWPGIPAAVVIGVLIADAYSDLKGQWEQRRHPSEVVRGYSPPARLSAASPVKAVDGTKAIVERLARAVYYGAPGQEAVAASFLLRHGLNRALRGRPVVDPQLVEALAVLTARS